MNDKPEEHIEHMGRLWATVLTIYGPYAFGLASLIIIWLYIVQPQLEMQALDFKAQQQIIDSLRELSTNQRNTADVMLRASTSMEVVSDRLQKMESPK
jgi:hypothetical protein